MENRNGLLVQTMLTQADGTAERDAALLMASKISGTRRLTLGADNNYDTREFVGTARERKIIGLLRKVKWRGREKVGWWFTFVGAAYNLVRLRRLRAEAVAHDRPAAKALRKSPAGPGIDL